MHYYQPAKYQHTTINVNALPILLDEHGENVAILTEAELNKMIDGMQKEFLKKFFPSYWTNNLCKQIVTFYQKYKKHFLVAMIDLNIYCSHAHIIASRYGGRKYLLARFKYYKQFIETICNSEILDKNANEAWDYFDSLTKAS